MNSLLLKRLQTSFSSLPTKLSPGGETLNIFNDMLRWSLNPSGGLRVSDPKSLSGLNFLDETKKLPSYSTKHWTSVWAPDGLLSPRRSKEGTLWALWNQVPWLCSIRDSKATCSGSPRASHLRQHLAEDKILAQFGSRDKKPAPAQGSCRAVRLLPSK